MKPIKQTPKMEAFVTKAIEYYKERQHLVVLRPRENRAPEAYKVYYAQSDKCSKLHTDKNMLLKAWLEELEAEE
jgi:hypothetical protein